MSNKMAGFELLLGCLLQWQPFVQRRRWHGCFNVKMWCCIIVTSAIYSAVMSWLLQVMCGAHAWVLRKRVSHGYQFAKSYRGRECALRS